MKTPLSFLGALLLLGFSMRAQETVVANAPQAPAAEQVALAATPLDPTQLEQLLGPIALYPDALIALILPASTVSSDVVLAARYLAAGGDPAKIDEQPWDDSVRALARYPEVVKWMDENLAWTKQLGEAFAAQPADVMNSVQRLRLKARAVGSLVDTPQQNVVVESDSITIVPAQPDVIYVPTYDPEIVYISRPAYYTQPFFTFGPAYATGFWLSNNLDWRRHRVWCVDRPHRETHWREHRDHWQRPRTYRPDYASRPDHYRPWTPRLAYTPSRSVRNRSTTIARPRYYNGSVNTGGGSRWDGNYARPAHATGERFPQPPSRGPADSRHAVTTVPQLPLADPLPHALPAPLPEAPQAAAPPQEPANNGNRRYPGRGNRSDRVDHNDRSNRPDYGRFPGSERRIPSPPAPGTVDSTPRASVGTPVSRPNYNSRHHAQPATPAAPVAIVNPAPVSTAPSTPAAAPTAPARGGENRRFDLPRDTPRRTPSVSGGRHGRGDEPER